MTEKKFLKLIDDNGKEMEYEILGAFVLASTGKNYVVYTDNTKDENGSINVYASIYYPDDDTKFEKIETEEEWEAVEKMLETIMQQ